MSASLREREILTRNREQDAQDPSLQPLQTRLVGNTPRMKRRNGEKQERACTPRLTTVTTYNPSPPTLLTRTHTKGEELTNKHPSSHRLPHDIVHEPLWNATGDGIPAGVKHGEEEPDDDEVECHAVGKLRGVEGGEVAGHGVGDGGANVLDGFVEGDEEGVEIVDSGDEVIVGGEDELVVEGKDSEEDVEHRGKEGVEDDKDSEGGVKHRGKKVVEDGADLIE